MRLDVRIPIGLLFVLFGAILTLFGLVSDPGIYRAHSLGLNVNLGWGLVQVVFGVAMLWLAYRARKAALALAARGTPGDTGKCR